MTRAHQPLPKQETKVPQSPAHKDPAARSGLFASARESSGEGSPRSPSQSGCHFGAMSILPPVQRKSLAALTELSPAEVQTTAARGTRGPGEPLPYLGRLQQAFGPHDLSGIRAHRDGQAASAALDIGARAFAQGDHIAFSDTPSLHDVAHEAAHVIQQRSGAGPRGGVDQPGDSLEQHAEQVASAVVSGRSAAPLLAQVPQGGGGGGPGLSVQRIPNEKKVKAKLEKYKNENQNYKIGDRLEKYLSDSKVGKSSARQIFTWFIKYADLDKDPGQYYRQYWNRAQKKNQLIGDFPEDLALEASLSPQEDKANFSDNSNLHSSLAHANSLLSEKQFLGHTANVLQRTGTIVSAPSVALDKVSEVIEDKGKQGFGHLKTATKAAIMNRKKDQILDEEELELEEIDPKKKKKDKKASKKKEQEIQPNENINKDWETFTNNNNNNNFDINDIMSPDIDNDNNNNDLVDDNLNLIDDNNPFFKKWDDNASDKGDDEALINPFASNKKLAKAAANSFAEKVWSYVASAPAYVAKKAGTIIYSLIDGSAKLLGRIGDTMDVASTRSQVEKYYEAVERIEIELSNANNKKVVLFSRQNRDNLLAVLDTLKRSRLFTLTSAATSTAASGVDSGLSKASQLDDVAPHMQDSYNGVIDNESDVKTQDKTKFSSVASQHKTFKKGAELVQNVKELVGLSSSDKNFVADHLVDIRDQENFEPDQLVATKIITDVLKLASDATREEVRSAI